MRVLRLGIFLGLVLTTRIAFADVATTDAGPTTEATEIEKVKDAAEPQPDYDTPRYEPAGFPLIAGDSDIGLQVGAAGTLTRFGKGIRPYRWNMDAVVGVSLKSGEHGIEVAQQFYRWQWDIPGLAGGRWRTNPYASYARTVNAGYFGVGNDSPSQPAMMSSGDPTK
ncbi:MAG: hypothetical protein ABIP89_16570, partial [Polyangiaceae bacterium]